MLVNFSLTSEGRAKLQRAQNRIAEHSKTLLLEGAERIVKVKASQRAPSPFEEASSLSTGEVSQGYRGSSGILGSNPDERRFKKLGNQRYLREAILLEKTTARDTGIGPKVDLGKTSSYDGSQGVSIGFSWKWGAKKTGGIRSTDNAEANQAWKHLLEAWELGGTAWNPFKVQPRGPNKYLEPERGILAKEMIKTIPQIGMFKQQETDSRPVLGTFMMINLKKKIQEEFGGGGGAGISVFGAKYISAWGRRVTFGPSGSASGGAK